jgi:hypothetical protein
MLDAVRTWFGMPVAAARLLEADCEALRMRRHEYFQHLVFERSLELREKGAGFEAPINDKKGRR